MWYSEEEMKIFPKELQDFIRDISCLDQLKKWTDRFNIFDVLKISRTEIRHSNMLAWLLNPKENHGLGDSFLRKLLTATIFQKQYQIINTSDVSIYREYQHIDILIEISINNNKTIIAIENKVDSDIHGDQLSDYEKVIIDMYGKNENIKTFFLFLTPKKYDKEINPQWTKITYTDILESLDASLDGRQLQNDVQCLINNYREIIRRDIVKDTELENLCREIYKKHRKALDLIFEHRMTIGTVIRDTLKSIEEDKQIIFRSNSDNTFLKFSSVSMNRIFPANENEEAYAFQITYDSKYITGRFVALGKTSVDNLNKIQRLIDNFPCRKNVPFDYKYIGTTIKEGLDADIDMEVDVRSKVILVVDKLLEMQKAFEAYF